MRLPSAPELTFSWPDSSMRVWGRLTQDATEKAARAGEGRHLQDVKAWLLKMLREDNFSGLGGVLKTRAGARACTRLWLEDRRFRSVTCKQAALKVIEQAHRPRLSRLTLSNLCELYLVEFDNLELELRSELSRLITQHCERIPSRDDRNVDNVWRVAKDYPWVFSENGPRRLVDKVVNDGRELESEFRRLGLTAYLGGRYGDVCRALYYLKALEELPYGETSPVMEELRKPSVHDAPYEDGTLIGHAALEIIIDRVEGEVPEAWQNFVLDIAGDPRVASASARYRKWWQALGQSRIEKVRGWLSKLDLKLFLDAVEEYGFEAGDHALQRMFPARKRFLEGLLKESLVAGTRLMLGWQAERIIKRILGENSGLNYAKLTGGMADKAVIYIDCGRFHLVEGSHNFKLWIYLAKPGNLPTDYTKTEFSHSDLTKLVPRRYAEENDSLRYLDVPHHGVWQRRVFEFLGDHGIGLPIETFLLPEDYKEYLSRFGLPYVAPH